MLLLLNPCRPSVVHAACEGFLLRGTSLGLVENGACREICRQLGVRKGLIEADDQAPNCSSFYFLETRRMASAQISRPDVTLSEIVMTPSLKKVKVPR